MTVRIETEGEEGTLYKKYEGVKGFYTIPQNDGSVLISISFFGKVDSVFVLVGAAYYIVCQD